MAFHYGLNCIELKKFFYCFVVWEDFSHALFYIIFTVSLMTGMAYIYILSNILIKYHSYINEI